MISGSDLSMHQTFKNRSAHRCRTGHNTLLIRTELENSMLHVLLVGVQQSTSEIYLSLTTSIYEPGT